MVRNEACAATERSILICQRDLRGEPRTQSVPIRGHRNRSGSLDESDRRGSLCPPRHRGGLYPSWLSGGPRGCREATAEGSSSCAAMAVAGLGQRKIANGLDVVACELGGV